MRNTPREGVPGPRAAPRGSSARQLDPRGAARGPGTTIRMAFITLDRVSRWYGKHQALCAVSLQLEPGRIGLLGPTGAGKSTLLKILLGLIPPSAGTGAILGHPITPAEAAAAGAAGWSLPGVAHDLFGAGAALRRQIGYMPEADALVPG